MDAVPLNLEVYRCRSWPYAFWTYVVVTWGPTKSYLADDGEADRGIDSGTGWSDADFTALVIPDDGNEEGFECSRYVFRTFEHLERFEHPTLESISEFDAHLVLVLHQLRSKILARIYEAWEEAGRPGSPTDDVELEEIEPYQLIVLKHAGSALRHFAEAVWDPGVQDFLHALLEPESQPWWKEEDLT